MSNGLMEIRMYNYHDKLITVQYFQLLQWIGCINLETQGLKHSRGSVTQHVRNILSAPRSYKRADLLAHLRETQKDVKEQLEGIS